MFRAIYASDCYFSHSNHTIQHTLQANIWFKPDFIPATLRVCVVADGASLIPLTGLLLYKYQASPRLK